MTELEHIENQFRWWATDNEVHRDFSNIIRDGFAMTVFIWTNDGIQYMFNKELEELSMGLYWLGLIPREDFYYEAFTNDQYRFSLGVHLTQLGKDKINNLKNTDYESKEKQ